MAKLLEPLSQEEVKKIPVAELRKEYIKLANFLMRILNGGLIYCSHCGKWKNVSSFYSSSTSFDKIEHYACRECILNECTDVDKSGNRIDNKQKTIKTFERLNWYFNEKTYDDQLVKISEGTGEKIRSTAVQQWIVMMKTLSQYIGYDFSNSEFLEDGDVIELTSKRKPRKEIIKLFGSGFTTEDYLYLQDQYDDWCSRTEVDGKSQQTYIIRICFKLLDIYKAQRSGKDTEKLDKSLNDLLAAANLQPRQNVGNASTDSLTFGQLIEKWEKEDPIPEPEEQFKDVDNISKFLNVWFKGSLSRSLNLDNGYSKEYDDYIKEYTVKPPEYMGDDDDSDENIYKKIFGTEDK